MNWTIISIFLLMTAILIVVAYTSYKIGIMEGRVKGLVEARSIMKKHLEEEDKHL